MNEVEIHELRNQMEPSRRSHDKIYIKYIYIFCVSVLMSGGKWIPSFRELRTR